MRKLILFLEDRINLLAWRLGRVWDLITDVVLYPYAIHRAKQTHFEFMPFILKCSIWRFHGSQFGKDKPGSSERWDMHWHYSHMSRINRQKSDLN